MSQPAISKHLKVLERAGLVSRGKRRAAPAGRRSRPSRSSRPRPGSRPTARRSGGSFAQLDAAARRDEGRQTRPRRAPARRRRQPVGGAHQRRGRQPCRRSRRSCGSTTTPKRPSHFYVSVFKDAKVGTSPLRRGRRPGGTASSSNFELHGQAFMALNGGPQFKFTEADLVLRRCADQAEVDYYWDKLSARRRQRVAVRLAEGQVRPVLAGHPDGAGRAAGRPGPGQGQPRHAGHAADEEDRHRRLQKAHAGEQ